MTLTLKVNTLETIFSIFKPYVLLEIKSEISMKFISLKLLYEIYGDIFHHKILDKGWLAI